MEKKVRAMTPKGFIKKSANVSALAFITAQRQWLESGELCELTSPVLARLDSGDILPTPCLETLRSIVMGYQLSKDTRIAEAKADGNGRKGKKEHDFIATIYNAVGVVQTRTNDQGEEVDLIQGFDSPSVASHWCDLRLISGGPDWFGIVIHCKMIDKETEEPMNTIVLRNDAIGRALRAKRGAVMAKKPQQSSLSWGAKVKNFTCHFSHG